MTTTIIAFPPGSGGNHLKNIVSVNTNELLSIYSTSGPTVHLTSGGNLKKEQIDLALADQSVDHVLHGHFGEIMSFQNEIRRLKNKKFIILSPDSDNDRTLLNSRRQKLGLDFVKFKNSEYFDGEQVFLYEPFMYHYYYQLPMDNIMNISISEWFVEDISSVISRLNYFLKSDLDSVKINQLHRIWIKNI
jgi:hypothetical protein